MGRIRTIKPEFPHSESMGRVSREARLLFILLWTLADDHGRLRGQPTLLASLLFPYDSDAAKRIPDWLDQLEDEGCVQRYDAAGAAYLQILNWSRHQKIDRPSASKLPQPEPSSSKAREDSRGLDEDSTKAREASCEDRDLDLDQDRDRRTKDQGGDPQGEGAVAPPARSARGRKTSRVPERPEDVSSTVWNEWLALRRVKRATVTETVLTGMRREAQAAGWGLEAVLKECVVRGWQGFRAEWVMGKNSTYSAHDIGKIVYEDVGPDGRF
ncbi:MAG: hypothetical protein RL148_231 [Planctomycetota bacterium]